MSDRIRASLGPLLRWETGLALVVVIIGIVGASVSSQFFTSNNIFNLGLSYGEIAIVTLPMTLIVISGEIDLSVASILGMSSALLGYLWARGWPMLGIFGLVAVVSHHGEAPQRLAKDRRLVRPLRLGNGSAVRLDRVGDRSRALVVSRVPQEIRGPESSARVSLRTPHHATAKAEK